MLRLFTDAEKRRFYLVLEGAEITRLLTLQELEALPARMAFFAQILELEDATQDVLLADPGRHVNVLRDKWPPRHAKAVSLAQRRPGSREPRAAEIVRASSFSTKWDLLCASESFPLAVPSMSREQARALIERVIRLRDSIAHGHPLILVNPHRGRLAAPDDPSEFRCDEVYGLFIAIKSAIQSLRALVGRVSRS